MSVVELVLAFVLVAVFAGVVTAAFFAAAEESKGKADTATLTAAVARARGAAAIDGNTYTSSTFTNLAATGLTFVPNGGVTERSTAGSVAVYVDGDGKAWFAVRSLKGCIGAVDDASTATQYYENTTIKRSCSAAALAGQAANIGAGSTDPAKPTNVSLMINPPETQF